LPFGGKHAGIVHPRIESIGSPLTTLEITLLKLAHRNFRGKKSHISDLIRYFTDVIGIDEKSSISVASLFLLNKRVNADYENITNPNRSPYHKDPVRTSNRASRELSRHLIPFKASNLSGKFVGSDYVIYSYGWYPVFVHKDGVWYENTNKYSVSTAKQMTQVRPTSDTIKLNIDDIKDLIR